VASGGLISRVQASGEVRAVALTHSHLAALVRTVTGGRIEVFDAQTGQVTGSYVVPRAAVPTALGLQFASPCNCTLSMSGARIVFRTGKTIRLIDTRARATSILATAASMPSGLSIVGNRVAWGENVQGHGRVRAVTL
jgi:hypothetical protein